MTGLDAPAAGEWKAVEVFVPAHLDVDGVAAWARASLQVIAYEAGDFIAQVWVSAGIREGNWSRHRAAYLPGPPGHMAGVRAAEVVQAPMLAPDEPTRLRWP